MQPAAWVPVLVLLAPAHLDPQGRHPARGRIDVPTCDDCRRVLVLDDVLTAEGFEIIARGFRRIGRAAPDRARTSLEWVRLDSDDAREFAAADARIKARDGAPN